MKRKMLYGIVAIMCATIGGVKAYDGLTQNNMSALMVENIEALTNGDNQQNYYVKNCYHEFASEIGPDLYIKCGNVSADGSFYGCGSEAINNAPRTTIVSTCRIYY